jgi:chromosome partitioning protein
MLKTIPIINNKGGVGKTTTTVNLAAGLGREGRRVLVIDLDSQGSASLALGIEREDLKPSTASVLFGEHAPADVIQPTATSNVDVLTGSLRLADADTKLSSVEGRENRLAHVLTDIEEEYDSILVDCAPSTSLLTVNALVAADAFIIPVAPSYLSLEGVVSLGKVVKNVRMSLGEAAPVLGVLLTMVQRDDEQTRAIIDEVRSHYGGKVFDIEIQHDPAIEEAPTHGRSVFDHAPRSQGADQYRAFVEEVLDRLNRYGSVYGTVREKQASRT